MGYNIAMLDKHENSIHNTVCDAFSEVKSIEPHLLSPLTLAYIGDTVFDLYIRSYLLHFSNAKVHGLHMRAIKSVCAQAQAKAYEIISPTLSEDEKTIFRRGRNAHNNTYPKHATIQEYKIATGLETLLGYLYLTGQDARMTEIMKQVLDYLFEEKEGKKGEKGETKDA